MSLNLGIIASSRASAPAVSLLLDTYPGAAAAYSLRKLRTAYTGAAIRVRRSSDNSELDIGFNVMNSLDTVALLSFVGVGNGFITIWYDQSTNGRNSNQTILANQPQIVSSGSLITSNLKPSILFNGTTNELFNSATANYLNNTAYSAFVVQNYNSPAKNDTYFLGINNNGTTNGSIFLGYRGSNTLTIDHYGNASNFSASFVWNTNVLLNGIFFKSPASEYYINNAILGSSANPSGTLSIASGGLQIGRSLNNGNYYYKGYLQEIILYNSNQLTNRTGISTNINSYYTIY
jgi:hypothetical protein